MTYQYQQQPYYGSGASDYPGQPHLPPHQTSYSTGHIAQPGPPPAQYNGYAPSTPAMSYPNHGHHYQQPYGAPPAASGYGMAYDPPPPQSMMRAFYLGVPVPPPGNMGPPMQLHGFHAEGIVDQIRKATKGFGTDEKALVAALAPLDALQMDAVSRTFKASVGKDLLTVLEKETSGWFEAALRSKVLGPVGYDAWLVHRACSGAGTHEDILNEVLLCRSNAEMHILKQHYMHVYHKDIVKTVQDDLSMKTKRLFIMALEGARQEENMPIDHNLVEQDARDIRKAARGAGTDEIKICGIMVSRSTAHLQALSQAYQHHHRTTLAGMVTSEFSGHMKDALLYIANTALPGPPGISRDAQLLEDSMAGMGTKDERLIYRVARAHWDRPRFEELKRAYAATQHKKGLRARVEGETSGDYKRMLVAMIGY